MDEFERLKELKRRIERRDAVKNTLAIWDCSCPHCTEIKDRLKSALAGDSLKETT